MVALDYFCNASCTYPYPLHALLIGVPGVWVFHTLKTSMKRRLIGSPPLGIEAQLAACNENW
jgi:hypothetical protein